MAHSTITLSSLYSSGQCLLSVIGSIGVILLFAGIPQLIYAPNINPGSLMTFLLGALLISLMVAGNAFIGYKYRQLVRQRRTEQPPASHRPSSSVASEDKPPSYDELLNAEGLPPAYATIITEKPPRYDDLVAEVFNWQFIGRSSSATNRAPNDPVPHTSGRSSSYPSEVPIIVPIQRHAGETSGNFSDIQAMIISKFKGGGPPSQPSGSKGITRKYFRSASFQQNGGADQSSKSFRPHCCITSSNSDGNLANLYYIHDQKVEESPSGGEKGHKKSLSNAEKKLSRVNSIKQPKSSTSDHSSSIFEFPQKMHRPSNSRKGSGASVVRSISNDSFAPIAHISSSSLAQSDCHVHNSKTTTQIPLVIQSIPHVDQTAGIPSNVEPPVATQPVLNLSSRSSADVAVADTFIDPSPV